MATTTGTVVQSVKKFTGLNESCDSLRELAMGEAAKAENFRITDGFNLKVRPGARRFADDTRTEPCLLWVGFIADHEYMVTGFRDPKEGETDITVYDSSGEVALTQTIHHEYGNRAVKVFTLGDEVYCSFGADIWEFTADWAGAIHMEQAQPYIPLVVTGADPGGGGTNLENLNILSDYFRIQYSGTGETAAYTLPSNCGKVINVSVDGEYLPIKTAGTLADHVFTFAETPGEGVNNIEFTCLLSPNDLLETRDMFAMMPYSEHFNGTTDSRLFFYGDGSHIMLYTGVTEAGKSSALYLPAGYEVNVDVSDSPVTSAVRHQTKLLVFKPDCCVSLTYSATSTAEDDTIAGFTMRTIHRTVGHAANTPAPLVGNDPWTLCNGNIYNWVVPNIYSAEQRNATVVSDKICKSVEDLDLSKSLSVYAELDKTYYIFTGEKVLVCRAASDKAWTIYTGDVFKDVKYAAEFRGDMYFMTANGLFVLDEDYRYDDANIPIKAYWHTGYMDFNADYKRKYSSIIWLSVKPESGCRFKVTASTDRRDEYTEKTVTADIFGYASVNYARWIYTGFKAPTTKKVKLKVKKFTYYQLKFEVEDSGAVATIIGYDQQVRYGSEVK